MAVNTTEVLLNAKKGDLFFSEEVIYEITEVQSGVYLLDRIWTKEPEIYGEKAIWKRSNMRLQIANGRFIFVPKAKKSTIQVLFT